MTLLSVLIPSRNEMFLSRTVQDLLTQMRGDSEVIVILDGARAEPMLPDDPRVRVIYYEISIGQRAATNVAARLAEGEFVMKLDAHCTVDEGYDVKLTEPYKTGEIGADVTTIPRMFNLHAFDWLCECGERTYQGPRPERCKKCQSEHIAMDMVWTPRWSRKTDFARFDTDLHFQYHGSHGKRPAAQGDIADVMCQVGACWLMSRERYWDLGGLDEGHGSWGQMGVEVSCKSWLSGGRQVVNKRTWFSHLFRTQPGFSFPYPISVSAQEHAREYSRQMWMENKWPGAKYPLSWLLEKFAPVPDWHDPAGAEKLAQVVQAGAAFENKGTSRPLQSISPSLPSPIPAEPTLGLIYYTDNRCEPDLWKAAQAQILRCCNGYELISVSLQPIDFGRNIVLPLERGPLTMFRQILAGLEASTADVVYLVEHDCLYHPSHFTHLPATGEFCYNTNNWKVDLQTGKALYYLCHQTLALCARRELLLRHYRARVARVEAEGRFDRKIGYEPGDHHTPRGIDDYPSVSWVSEFPNLDVRHSQNLTSSRWRQSEFRNQKACTGWKEAEVVLGWGRTAGMMQEVLSGELRM